MINTMGVNNNNNNISIQNNALNNSSNIPLNLSQHNLRRSGSYLPYDANNITDRPPTNRYGMDTFDVLARSSSNKKDKQVA